MAQVALSFDNGPHPDITPLVLDVLRNRGVCASFFVLGSRLESAGNVRLVERALAEGHRVGNHSYSHRVPLGEDSRPDAVDREIAATQRLLDRIPGTSRSFRPFGRGGKIGPHLLSRSCVEYLTANCFDCVLWNCVPEDWIDEEGWVDRALRDCDARPASLVVMHDVLPVAMRHLDRFIGSLVDAGHTIAPDYPAECLPIIAGRVMRDISQIIS